LRKKQLKKWADAYTSTHSAGNIPLVLNNTKGGKEVFNLLKSRKENNHEEEI